MILWLGSPEQANTLIRYQPGTMEKHVVGWQCQTETWEVSMQSSLAEKRIQL